MESSSHHRFALLIERHLALEAELANDLDTLNLTMQGMLAKRGMQGPAQQEIAALDPITEKIQCSVEEIRRARAVLLERLNLESEKPLNTLKESIAALPPADRVRLDAIRRSVLGCTSKARAELLKNQAAIFYTFEFHRRFMAEVLQTDSDRNSYRANGQPYEPAPGNILGRTC